MATLWGIVTGNSILPVQAGNNFWDHLNNQAGGGGTTVIISGIRSLNKKGVERSINRDDLIKAANRAQTARQVNKLTERTINLDLSYEANRCQ